MRKNVCRALVMLLEVRLDRLLPHMHNIVEVRAAFLFVTDVHGLVICTITLALGSFLIIIIHPINAGFPIYFS